MRGVLDLRINLCYSLEEPWSVEAPVTSRRKFFNQSFVRTSSTSRIHFYFIVKLVLCMHAKHRCCAFPSNNGIIITGSFSLKIFIWFVCKMRYILSVALLKPKWWNFWAMAVATSFIFLPLPCPKHTIVSFLSHKERLTWDSVEKVISLFQVKWIELNSDWQSNQLGLSAYARGLPQPSRSATYLYFSTSFTFYCYGSLKTSTY